MGGARKGAFYYLSFNSDKKSEKPPSFMMATLPKFVG